MLHCWASCFLLNWNTATLSTVGAVFKPITGCWRHPLPVLQAGKLPPGSNDVLVKFRLWVLTLRAVRRPWGLDATYLGLPPWEIIGLNVHFHKANQLNLDIYLCVCSVLLSTVHKPRWQARKKIFYSNWIWCKFFADSMVSFFLRADN